jgi:hypothetical protein
VQKSVGSAYFGKFNFSSGEQLTEFFIEISSCFFQLVLEFVQQVLSNSELYKSTRYFQKPKELPSKLLILSYFWMKTFFCRNFLRTSLDFFGIELCAAKA